MPTDITCQAGKGLQRQLMISSPKYRQRHEEIFGKKKPKLWHGCEYCGSNKHGSSECPRLK